MIELRLLPYIAIIILVAIHLVFESMKSMIETKNINLFLPFFIMSIGFFGLSLFGIAGFIDRIFLNICTFLGISLSAILLEMEARKNA